MGDRFVVGWYRAMVGGFFALAAFMFLNFTDSREPGAASASWALVAVCLLGSYRGLRCASVTVGATGITIRGLYRTHRLSWDEVESVDFGAGSSAGIQGWIIQSAWFRSAWSSFRSAWSTHVRAHRVPAQSGH